MPVGTDLNGNPELTLGQKIWHLNWGLVFGARATGRLRLRHALFSRRRQARPLGFAPDDPPERRPRPAAGGGADRYPAMVPLRLRDLSGAASVCWSQSR